MKKLAILNGVKVLGKVQQKSINGGGGKCYPNSTCRPGCPHCIQCISGGFICLENYL